MGGANLPVLPWPLRRLGLRLHGSSRREAAAPRLVPNGRVFSPSIHVGRCRRGRSGLVSVFVFAAAALVHCARRGYGILFPFLAASPPGAEPASVDCALQRCSRSPIISVENANIRSNACCATLLVWTATCFSTIKSSFVFSLLQCTQLGSSPKTFSYNPYMLRVR